MFDWMWFDFGDEFVLCCFCFVWGVIVELMGYVCGCSLVGYGFGLLLFSVMLLDEVMFGVVVVVVESLCGFVWYSEYLSVFVMLGGVVVLNVQVGLGLLIVYGDESFELLCLKLGCLNEVLGCCVLLENLVQFLLLIDFDCSEFEFLNWLYCVGVLGMLLDLYNFYVCQCNGVIDLQVYLEVLDLDSVEEVYLVGGDEFGGFYMDSYVIVMLFVVWELVYEFLLCCCWLWVIMLEYQEFYFEQIGLQVLGCELELMYELVECCIVEYLLC